MLGKGNVLIFCLLSFSLFKSSAQSIKQIDSIIKKNAIEIYDIKPSFLTKDSIPNRTSVVNRDNFGKHYYAVKQDKDITETFIFNERIISFLFKMRKNSDGSLCGNFSLINLQKNDFAFENRSSNIIITTPFPGIVFKDSSSGYTLLIRVSKNGDFWPRRRSVVKFDSVVHLPEMDLKSILNNDIAEVLLFDSYYNLKCTLLFKNKTTVIFSFDKNIKKNNIQMINGKSIENSSIQDIVAEYYKCSKKGHRIKFASIEKTSIIRWLVP